MCVSASVDVGGRSSVRAVTLVGPCRDAVLHRQAVFTREKGSFRSVYVRALFNEDKYRLALEDEGVRRAFSLLLAHSCTRCQPAKTFPVFKQLSDHMLRHHQLHFCELCVKHLKVGVGRPVRR